MDRTRPPVQHLLQHVASLNVLPTLDQAATSDILQISEGTAGTAPPAKRPAGAPKDFPWPPPVAMVERTQVFLSAGSVAALGERP